MFKLCCFEPFQKDAVILIGAPGSGKGTAATRLTKEIQLPHISTGDILRAHVKQGTLLGRSAKSYMEMGQLVPDELVQSMLKERIEQADCHQGFILDGFPRTVAQAEALQTLMQGMKVVVINLDVDDEVVVERIAGRLLCKRCGQVYHRIFDPTKEPGKCDKDQCKGAVAQREDDRESVVRVRLKAYHAQTKPVEDFYAKKGWLYKVDAGRTAEDSYVDMMKILKASKRDSYQYSLISLFESAYQGIYSSLTSLKGRFSKV